jgi:hypothetical protein
MQVRFGDRFYGVPDDFPTDAPKQTGLRRHLKLRLPSGRARCQNCLLLDDLPTRIEG